MGVGVALELGGGVGGGGGGGAATAAAATTATGRPEQQGQQNAHGALPGVAQVKGHNFFTSENDNIKCAMVECFYRSLQGRIHHHITANRM